MTNPKFRAYIHKLGIMLYGVAVYPNGNIGIGIEEFEAAVKAKNKDWHIYDDEVIDCSKDADGDEKYERLMSFLPGDEWVWLEEGQYELEQCEEITNLYQGDEINVLCDGRIYRHWENRVIVMRLGAFGFSHEPGNEFVPLCSLDYNILIFKITGNIHEKQ